MVLVHLNKEKIFLVIFFGNLKMTFIIKMSFFDLIEKGKVFLNEYLLFQKNRKYDKYTNEIQRFFKVKKVYKALSEADYHI